MIFKFLEMHLQSKQKPLRLNINPLYESLNTSSLYLALLPNNKKMTRRQKAVDGQGHCIKTDSECFPLVLVLFHSTKRRPQVASSRPCVLFFCYVAAAQCCYTDIETTSELTIAESSQAFDSLSEAGW